MQCGARRHADEVEDRRHHVDVLHRRRHAAPGMTARQLDHQRHVRRLAVEKHAVLLLAVIAEPLAVVREQHDGRSIVELRRAKAIEQAADELVGIRDLAVVRIVLRETLGRRIRLVRLVEMQKEKKRFRTLTVEPFLGRGERLRSIALHLSDR